MGFPSADLAFDKEAFSFELKDTSMHFTHIVIHEFNQNDSRNQPLICELTLKDSAKSSNFIDLFADNPNFERKGDVTQIRNKKDLRFKIQSTVGNQPKIGRFWFCLHDCNEKRSIIKSKCP